MSEKTYDVVELGAAKKTGYENRIEDLLRSFIDTGEREAEIYVFKYRGKTQQQGLNLIETYPADLHTYASLFHAIRNKYGAGMYRIHIKKGKEVLVNDPMEILEQRESMELSENRQPDETNKKILEYIAKSERSGEGDFDAQEMRFLRKMEIYRGMFQSGGGGVQGVQQGSDILGVISLLEKLGLTVSKKEEESFTDIVKSALPVFERIAAQSQAQVAPQQVKKAAVKKSEEAAAIDPIVSFFLSCARENGDPELYAHVLLDKLPEQFVNLFVGEGYQELIERLHKDFRFYPDWVAKVRIEMISILNEGSDEQEQEEEQNTQAEIPRRPEGGEVDSAPNLQVSKEILN